MATLNNNLDERDQQFLAALLDIAVAIRTLQITLVSAIAPAQRDHDGKKTREGFLRTEEMDSEPAA